MTITTVILQAGNEPLNASSSVTSGFGDSSGLLGVTIVLGVYIVGALLAAQFVAPWLARSTILGTVGDGLLTGIAYALKGAASSAVLAVVAMPAYLFITADAGTRGVALRYVGYGVAAFLGLIVVGWLADRAVSRFIEAHPDYDSWAEMWETEDDDTPDGAEVADD